MTIFSTKPDPYFWATSTFTTSLMYTTTLNSVQTTSDPSPTANSGPVHVSNNFWHNLAHGARIAIIAVIIIGIIAVALFSIWFCCSGRARYRGKQKQDGAMTEDTRSLPLHTSPSRPRREGIEDREAAPPIYEEALPPQHETVVGGITYDGEGEGVVADGKTPLSEILLEDALLHHNPSESPSRASEERYHGGGEDLRGRTID